MRFVLDNSVVMRWLFGDGSASDLAYANRILSAFEDEDTEAVVPMVWMLEVANVIARTEAQGLIVQARSAEFLGILAEMAVCVDSATAAHALGETLALARRFGLSSYDAAYLELALREGLPLATLDNGLRKAIKKIGGRIA